MPNLQENNFDYEDFIQRMKHPNCRPYLTKMKGFIKDFENFPADEQSRKFHEFHQRIWAKLMQLDSRQASSVFDKEVNARGGLEYLLMNQLAEKAFRQSTEHPDNRIQRFK